MCIRDRLSDYTILKGVNSYAALGRYYLANETTVPEELYEYMDPVSYTHLVHLTLGAGKNGRVGIVHSVQPDAGAGGILFLDKIHHFSVHHRFLHRCV